MSHEIARFEGLARGLNSDQYHVFELVVHTHHRGEGGSYFLYGSGGIGKTYLWNTIISRGVSYSVQNRTGPRTGPDRPGPGHFGPVLGPKNFHFRSSVPSQFRPMDRIKVVSQSCRSARADRAPKKRGWTE